MPDTDVWYCRNCKQNFESVNCRCHEIKAENPLRIFLSYGHDSNESLVIRIRDDLTTRGHDVWFDKHEIQFGDDWRRAITDGIVHSNRVLSFLSKHSTRDPGVCLDEIGIAIGVKGGNIQTILVESESEVNPPVSISHIQWLDMHDWQERKNSSQWKSWYQSKLQEIIRVIESDESRRFAGEIEILKGYLTPIISDTRIAAMMKKSFIGRKWLFMALEDWRSEDNNSRLFWITGTPGVGKSAFAANLAHFGRDKVIAAQFVEWDKPDHRDARRVVQSIAFQLATRLPDYRRFLITLPEINQLGTKNPAELFTYLITAPLTTTIQGNRERYLIIIDALDEASEGGRNPLVEMLARDAQNLPDWLSLVITSRPESAVTAPLQGMNPIVIATNSEYNLADIREYLQYSLASQLQNRTDAESLVEHILAKSEGVFLYVERFCEDVKQGHLSLDHPEQFPQGLGGVYFQFFKRQFPNQIEYEAKIEPALGAILAAREPLPVEILQKLFDWRETEFKKFLRTLGSLFPVIQEKGIYAIKPYHKSLIDWLSDDTKAGENFVSIMEGHRLLADWGWKDFVANPATMNLYFLKHLPMHLKLTGDISLSQQVRSNKKFLEARDTRFYGPRKEMKVFISSAFQDTQAERDYLVRRTFPELNRLLSNNRINAIPVDLRWGIPDDNMAEHSWLELKQVIFKEIDACRPFFIALIGKKYGWIPYGQNTSTIEDELNYSISNSLDPSIGKYLYKREETSLANVPVNELENFSESTYRERDSKQKILSESLDEKQIVQRSYSCYWDETRKQLWGLQEFGNLVLNDLYESALKVYGVVSQFSNKNEIKLQNDYTFRLMKNVVVKPLDINQLTSLFTSSPIVKLCLTGESGVGKSTMLTCILENLQTNPRFYPVFHYAGTSGKSLTVRGVLESWSEQLLDWINVPLLKTTSDDELRTAVYDASLLALDEYRIVFLLDNADWLESCIGPERLNWLLRSIPETASILSSSRNVQRFEQFNLHTIHCMSRVEMRRLTKTTLSEYSKELSNRELDLIVNKPGLANPGNLVLFLRLLGTSVPHRDLLTDYLQSWPDTFTGLCNVYFLSMESDYGVKQVRSVMDKVLSIDCKPSENDKFSDSDLEIIRQIYSVFPEYTTPVEDGLNIRPGELYNFIYSRYRPNPDIFTPSVCKRDTHD
ncbi:MAG: TIR domain-containing protein [bacterium]|nr:TIR domain-containing protein [bacterium]